MSIATYNISSSMAVYGATVERTNWEIMSLLTRNTSGRITTDIKRSVMPKPRQLLLYSPRAIFTNDSKCCDIFPVLWETSRRPTSSVQCRLACYTPSRSGYPTSWRCTNGSTSRMQYGHPCLRTTTSHRKLSHMRKFLNGMGRRWRKWAGTCLEL